MSPKPPKKKRVVFLFSDTGGGHRSAAEAIIKALRLEYPDTFKVEMVDFFADYAPPPFNWAGPTYPMMSRITYLWSLGFRISDDPDRMRVLYSTLWPYISPHFKKLINDHPCDLMISVHPLVNIPMLRALKNQRTPYIIVVTDLVSTHAAWYTNDADLVIIPTEQAVRKATAAHMQAEKIRIVGLPVSDEFCQPIGNKNTLRQTLKWEQEKTTALLVGGGEGMGPLETIASNINKAEIPMNLAIVTGRNKKLKQDLEQQKWNMPVYIYGFVHNMPDLMRAADILITKAGPGTISEAFIAGIPIILYHRVSGQEEGNVSYVVDEGAGIWAPEPEDIVTALEDWLIHPEKRSQAAEKAKKLARPHAAREIAQIIANKIIQ